MPICLRKNVGNCVTLVVLFRRLSLSENVVSSCNNLTAVRHFCFVPFQFANADFTVPISETVDNVIQNCPIDVRRGLYKVRSRTSENYIQR